MRHEDLLLEPSLGRTTLLGSVRPSYNLCGNPGQLRQASLISA
jgi:hypothetical protein